jgi:prephenate dehydrogenase
MRQITVVGVGLLGGSVGLAAKAAYEGVRVVGVGWRQSSLDKAVECGSIDQGGTDTTSAVREADLVVLATPLGVYPKQLAAIAAGLKCGATVTDVGSTKAGVAAQAARVFGPAGPFVGSHPMAGSERRGVEFARADLFCNATCIVASGPSSPKGHVRRVCDFWQKLGAVVVRMPPREHDAAVGRVSHLPHLLASMIVRLQNPASLALAGPGFVDTTRIASGDAAMWREILLSNRPAMLKALDDAAGELATLREMLAERNEPALEEYLRQAKSVRDALVATRLKRQA